MIIDVVVIPLVVVVLLLIVVVVIGECVCASASVCGVQSAKVKCSSNCNRKEDA